ncbi:MAG: SsrA-binding protein SmpB [Desulfobia sp.]
MPEKVMARNKKAYSDYHIETTLEAGIVLKGPEIKSIRAGRVNLKDGYAHIKNGEAWLHNIHISPYRFATHESPDPRRTRKLLLSKNEIKKLIGKVKERGYTLIPLKIYLNSRGLAKLSLGLCKGKSQYDKRHALKKKDLDREMGRMGKWPVY